MKRISKFVDPRIREALQMDAIKERLPHYEEGLLEKQRKKLVDAWRAAYPQAVSEVSSYHPLIRMVDWVKLRVMDPDECWYSDIYHVTLRRHKKDPVFHSKGGMIQLGINTHEGHARHDWRDFQEIKNQLAGKETEAFELYPADSRLLDPSNYYSLWCFPSLNGINVGIFDSRDVRDQDVALAPQRGFAKQQLSIQQENDKLRYLLAKGNDPCIYCGLKKEDMVKCESGFPGCGRADDLMMCEELERSEGVGKDI
jgi:hypothetical protein